MTERQPVAGLRPGIALHLSVLKRQTGGSDADRCARIAAAADFAVGRPLRRMTDSNRSDTLDSRRPLSPGVEPLSPGVEPLSRRLLHDGDRGLPASPERPG